jgi:uncharacterized protein YndB with AHSA1/START domain
MEKIHFKIAINAASEKVWKVLWDKHTYEEWTAPFSAGSTVVTDWKKGSKTLFLNNAGEGMVSRIAENIPNEHMSIHHLGLYKNGIEDYDSDEVKKWGNAFENYTLRSKNQVTELTVEMDIQTAYKSYFEEIWPTALAKVKALAETIGQEI